MSAIHVSYSGDVASQYASFVYDDTGNMTTRTLLQARVTKSDSSYLEETKTYNSIDEILTSSIDDGSTVVNYIYGHDSNGNLTSKTDGTNTWTYTWDDENRLTAVAENSTTIASYEYDSSSRLLQRVAGGTTTNYTWDGWDLIKEEKTGAVTETTRYAVPQGGVQSFVRNGNRYYLHGDGLSSSQLVTDANGNVAARIIYDAWGNELYASDSVPNGLDARFVGGLGVRNDPTTGLVYMRHRWYDAGLGRFLSRDPIGFKGGLNLYSYANANPTTLVDPAGLFVVFDPVAAEAITATITTTVVSGGDVPLGIVVGLIVLASTQKTGDGERGPIGPRASSRTFAYVNEGGDAIGDIRTADILQRLSDAAVSDPSVPRRFAKDSRWRRDMSRNVCTGETNYKRALESLRNNQNIYVANKNVARQVLFHGFWRPLEGNIRNETGWGPTESEAKYGANGSWYHWDDTFTETNGQVHLVGHRVDDWHGQIPHLQIHHNGSTYRLFYIR